MKVAYYSPMPPERSGIADYSALLLPALQRRLDVEVARRGRRARGDVALYHVGNDPESHGWIVEILRREPGVVVLHDFVLHHLVAGITLARKDGPGYLAAMERDAGLAGRLLAHGVLDGHVAPLWETCPEDFPLVGDVLDSADGLIVHSTYVEARAREAGYEGMLWKIPHPAWPAPQIEPERVAGRPIFGCFGHLNASKRVPQLVDAFGLVRARHPDARLLLVGPASPGFDIDPFVVEGVERIDYVGEERLWSLMAACDACVLLRAPTMGETSGSAIRALSLGRPVIVSDVGWFAELPDEVAFKIAVGDGEVPALAATLELLAANEGTGQAMGEAAREYAAREHDVNRVADLYTAALEDAAGGTTVADAVVREVARAAADVGLEPGTPSAAGLSTRLDELGVLRNGRRAPVVTPPPAVASPLDRVPVGLWLLALVVFSSLVRYALSRRVVAPWIMVDELVYSELAKSFAATGELLIRGQHHGDYGVVYPVLIAPAWKLFSSIPDAYEAAKASGSVAMSLAAIPAYFLARRVVPPLASLGAAVLAVAVPSMVYTGTLMTETVFYPLFLCVALALVLALERPTALRQLVLLGACLLAFLTRTQAVVLVPAVATAPVLLALVERRGRSVLKPFRVMYGILGSAVVAVLAVQLARGHSPYGVLGAYGVTGQTHYRLGDVLRWLVYHLAELDLYLGILPFAALALLAATARSLDRAARVFVVAAVSLSGWLIVEVAAFASTLPMPPRVEERNMFYLAPLFLIALLLWIDRGLPRLGRAAAVCAVVAAASPGVLPYDRLIDTPAESDTLALIPLWWLKDHVIATSEVALVVVVVAAILACVFLFVPPRWAYVLPGVVLGWFVFTQDRLESFGHGFPKASVGALYQGITNPHRDWVDRAVGKDANVAFVWSGENDNARALQLWENEFFNRSVHRVYDLHRPSPGGLPETPLTQTYAGRLLAGGTPLRPEYVLSDVNAHLLGRVVAQDQRKGIVLLRPGGQVRLVYTVTGLYATDTWSSGRVTYTRLQCRGGKLTVSLASDPSLFRGVQTVTARSAGRRFATTFDPARAATLSIPLRPRAGRCIVTFTVTPTAVPALVDKRSTDTRVLGAHFLSFRYAGP